MKIVWCVFVLVAVSAAGEVVVTQVGKKAILDCGVRSSSFRSLNWLKGNDLIVRVTGKDGKQFKGKAPVQERSKVKLETKLEITRVAEEDAGKFKCEVDGKTKEYTLLLVKVTAIPSTVLQLGIEATLQCQVKGLDQGPVVQWKRPDGRLEGSEEVKLSPVAMADAGIWQCVFNTFSESVTITVEDRMMVPTSSIHVTTKSSDDSRRDLTNDLNYDDIQWLGLSWWIWLALGAGCLVLVLLLVLAIILCQRIRRKKRRKFLRMKNVPQPLRPRKYCECDRPTAAAKPQQGRRREKPSALPL